MMHKLHQIHFGAFVQITSAVVSICPADVIFSSLQTGAEHTCDLVAFLFLSFKLEREKSCCPWKYKNVIKAKHFFLLLWKIERWDIITHIHFKRWNARQLPVFCFISFYQPKSPNRASLTTHLSEFSLTDEIFFFFFLSFRSLVC